LNPKSILKAKSWNRSGVGLMERPIRFGSCHELKLTELVKKKEAELNLMDLSLVNEYVMGRIEQRFTQQTEFIFKMGTKGLIEEASTPKSVSTFHNSKGLQALINQIPNL
jgi:hypothetical protein